MAVSIGPTIGIKGEREFRASLKEIVAEVQSYRAEMEKLTASFSKNDDAITRNKKAQENLNEQISIQEKVLQDNINLRDKAAQKYSEQVMLVDAYGKAVSQESQMLEEMGQRLEGLRERYGDNDAVVKGATDTYAKLRKQLADDSEAYDKLRVDVHRTGQSMQEWGAKVTQAEMELTRMRKELAKAPNYVEEFKRKTEDSKKSLEGYNRQMQTLDSQLKLIESSYQKNTSALQKHKDYVDHLTTAIEQQKKIVEENRKVHEQAEQALQKQRDEYDKLAKKLSEAEKQYGKDSEQAKILNDALEEQAKLVDEAEKQTDEYTKAVLDAETAQKNFENELKQNSGLSFLGSQIQEAGEKMEKFGENMTKYVTTPLVGLSTYAIKTAADFQDAMAKIYTIAIDSDEPMEKMHDELVALSNDTGFDLSDLGEATYQAVSASVDAGKAVEFMGDATKLARAGFTSTTKAVDLLTTVINAYGMKAEDASKISDILLKTQNDGKTILDELASSMGIIIPMASNYNVGLDQIAAAYATMTKQGVKTERATTFLRAVFTELEKESSDVADILMEKTGKSFAQLMGEGKDLGDVLKILYDYVGGNAEEFQRLFGNVRATQAVASLVAEGVGEDAEAFGMLHYELGRVRDSAGQTDKALEVMETPALKARKAVNRLKNSAEDLGETMIDMAMPAFEKVTSKITELTEGFINLQPETKGVIVKTGALAMAIAPVSKGLGVLVKYVGGLLAGTAPLLPLVAGVTALFVGLTAAAHAQNVEHIEQIRNTYGLSDAMKDELAELEELKTSHAEFKQAMQDRNTATMNQVGYVQELVAQYDGLVGKNGEVRDSQKQLADHIINEIANALGIEVDKVKGLIDENGKLSQSIQQTIEDFKQQAMLAVMQDEFTEALHRKVTAEKAEQDITEQLAIASQKQIEANNELKAAQAAVKKESEEYGVVSKTTSDRLADATAKSQLAEKTTKELKTALWDAKEMSAEASKEAEYYSNKIDEVGKESKETADQIESDAKRAENAIKTSGDNVIVSLDGYAKSAYKSGEMVARGFAAGIDDYSYLAGMASTNMGANASKKLNYSVQVKSPSRVAMKTGRYFAQGFGIGMEDGMPSVNKIAEQLGQSASSGLSFGSYLPENVGSVVNNTKTISAPISVNLTVNGNVDDSDTFARNIARNLQDLINRERGVFA